jgi:hypothetical protein
MSTFYSQGSGAFSTTTNWDTNRGGGGTDPASADEAGMAGHTFVIQPNHSIEYDMDMSGWSGTTGLYALTIEGHASTPGMLYCKYSAAGTYHLKIQGGSTSSNIIQGTNLAAFGRLLANSDGVWANSTALPNDRKFIIEFMGTTAGRLTDQYLDVKLLCTQPTNEYVHVHSGTVISFNGSTAVNTSTDVIDLGTTPPSAGTDVVLVPASGATLPTPFVEDVVYYVRAVSGNTCKLARQNSDATIVDITVVGSGTIYLLQEPASGSGSATLNVLEDVTSDAPWSATSGHNRVVLVDAGAPADYDIQRVTISSITDADTIVISADIDSAQYAGCKLFLSSRNISIRSNSTSTTANIIYSFNTSRTTVNTYQCEIVNLVGGYTYGANSSSGHIFSGVISSCNYGLGNSGACTVSGVIVGCTTGVYQGAGNILSGIIAGCNYGVNSGTLHILSGVLSGCTSGIYFPSGATITGVLSGCNNAIQVAHGITVSGVIEGNAYSFADAVGDITVKRGAKVVYSISAAGRIGQKYRISVEDHAGTADAAKVYDNMGNIIKTACDGATADYPDQDPDGGSGYAIEASNLQSKMSAADPLYIISDRKPHRVWLTAGSYTITYKVYSTFAISDGNLVLTATYISAASPRAITVGTDSQAISAKTSDTDWSQTLSISITTAADGWVDLDIYLTQYSSGGAVFVWPKPTIT